MGIPESWTLTPRESRREGEGEPLRRMSAPTEIATKLKLTTQALGCSSLKDLCARFRAANASTYFDLQRSQKWVQGKAEPRFPQVYQDWAKVLALPRDGAWIAACSLEEFQAELLARFGPGAGQAPAARALARAPATLGVEITGLYAVYSMAWSPHFVGRILRASLQLGRTRAGAISAEYREDLPIGATLFRGEAAIAGRTLHLPLRDVTTGLPLFMSFALPGPPASVMCGVQCGAALISHSAEPAAGRILLVRLPGAPDLRASNRYMAPGESVAADLTALGLAAEPALDGLLGAVLGRVDRVTTSEQEQLAAAFDPPFLAC